MDALARNPEIIANRFHRVTIRAFVDGPVSLFLRRVAAISRRGQRMRLGSYEPEVPIDPGGQPC